MTDFTIRVIFTAHFGDGSEIKVHGHDIADLTPKRGSCETI